MIRNAVTYLARATPSRTPPPLRQLCAGAGAVLLAVGAALLLAALLLRKAGGKELPGMELLGDRRDTSRGPRDGTEPDDG